MGANTGRERQVGFAEVGGAAGRTRPDNWPHGAASCQYARVSCGDACKGSSCPLIGAEFVDVVRV
jgi:hypothetical protein